MTTTKPRKLTATAPNGEIFTRRTATEVSNWDKEKRVYVGTGIFRTKVRAVAAPVNA